MADKYSPKESHQEKINSILNLWEEHKMAKFPNGLRGEEIDGIDLVLLDSDTTGCIDMFLHSNKFWLDIARTAILGLCYRDISITATRLEGESKKYFKRLETLSQLTLEVVIKKQANDLRTGKQLSPEGDELYKRTDEVLHYLWNPIGVSDCPGARDEYWSYLPKVYSLLIKKEPKTAIIAYLLSVETDYMELSPDKARVERVVDILEEYRDIYENE